VGKRLAYVSGLCSIMLGLAVLAGPSAQATQSCAPKDPPNNGAGTVYSGSGYVVANTSVAYVQYTGDPTSARLDASTRDGAINASVMASGTSAPPSVCANGTSTP
jgi:hypothetical protein